MNADKYSNKPRDVILTDYEVQWTTCPSHRVQFRKPLALLSAAISHKSSKCDVVFSNAPNDTSLGYTTGDVSVELELTTEVPFVF